MKEKFNILYKNFVPTCSELVSAYREGNRFYGVLNCKIHGEYSKRGDDLKHRGCKNCNRERIKREYDENWKKECSIIHNNKYDYSETEVGDVLTYSSIRCKSCNTTFEQTPASHKTGRGCINCSAKIRGISRRNDINFVQNKAKEIGFNYNFKNSIYITCKDDIEIICDKGHTFFQSPDELLNAEHGCYICSKAGTSKQEKELFNFISRYYKCDSNNRKVLDGKELDIYIPSRKVGIEYNGLYWHANDKIKTSHFDKLNLASNKNTHLIFIYENDWLTKQEAVKNKIKDNLKIKDNDFIEVHFKDLNIYKSNESDIDNLFRESSLEPLLQRDGYYVMKLNEEIIGMASYREKDKGSLITEVLRPLHSTQTDYYDNFIKYFQNEREAFKILASLDWLDDLFLKNLNVEFDKLVKNVDYYIENNTLKKESGKNNLKTLTKAGYAIYKL